MIFLLRQVLIFCIFLSFSSLAQDAEFSQYYAAQMYLNPSLIGFEDQSALSLSTRTQWQSINQTFTTQQASFHFPIYTKEKLIKTGAFGLSFYQNSSSDGSFKTLGINANLVINAILSERSLMSFGIQAGVIQKNLDLNNFNWSSQYDPFIGFDASIDPGVRNLSDNTLFPDIGAGIVYGNNLDFHGEDEGVGFYTGLSAFHLNQPNEALGTEEESELPILFKHIGGLAFTIGPKTEITPNYLINYQKLNYQINLGISSSYQLRSENGSSLIPTHAIGGVWHRINDAFIFIAGLQARNYIIGFSYDMNSSSLRRDGFGTSAYEISLTLMNSKKGMKKIHSPRI